MASTLTSIAAPPKDAAVAAKQWLGGQPGGIAGAWIDAGGVSFFNAGRYSSADSRPITADTQFEIGSITKVFTALLLADSVRAGKITLDTPIAAPFAPSKITYGHLATHTAGLGRLPREIKPASLDNPYAALDLAGLVKSFNAAAPAAKVSAKASYSNFGYAVLGQALAGAWGEPYAPLLARRVLGPLGLKDTVTAWTAADRSRLAPGSREGLLAQNWDMNAYAPAGVLVSTTRDLARLVQACLDLVETPLRSALADTLESRVPDEAGNRRIGLAWVIEQRGGTVVWHNGGTGGYESFIAFDPARKTGVVLLTNNFGGHDPARQGAFTAIMSALFSEPKEELESLGFSLLAPAVPNPSAVTLPSAHLDDCTGRFFLGKSVLALTHEGDRMFVQLTGQSKIQLYASAKDEFFAKDVNAQLSFLRGPDGRVMAVVLHQGGFDQRAEKAP